MRKEIKFILSSIIGVVIGYGISGRKKDKEICKVQQYSKKHLELFLLMNQWVKIKQEGKNLSSYFEKNNYKKIAVYGMSYVGETLIQELQNSNINVVYGIDKRADSMYTDIDIVSCNQELREVDAIIVTAITFFDEIEDELSRKVECPIISLQDVLYEI